MTSPQSIISTHLIDLAATTAVSAFGAPSNSDTITMPLNTSAVAPQGGGTNVAYSCFYIESVEVIQARNNLPGSFTSQPTIGTPYSLNTTSINISFKSVYAVITTLGPFTVGGKSVGKRTIIYNPGTLPSPIDTDGILQINVATAGVSGDAINTQYIRCIVTGYLMEMDRSMS